MSGLSSTLLRRIQNIFVRGTFQSRSADGSITAQQLPGEVSSDIPNPQNYGFASKGVGGKTYTICNGGNRDASTVILHELAGAPTLADDEVAVWNNKGATVILKDDGTIELQGSAFGGLIKINDLTAKINLLVTAYNAHTHIPQATPQMVPLAVVDYENGTVNHG